MSSEPCTYYANAMIDRYDIRQTWKANLHNSPSVNPMAVHSQEALSGSWSWCGVPVHSPLGISAGPLLNSHWLLYYAELGFDILVYKTVRSTPRDCYPLPNLVPVDTPQLSEGGTTVPESSVMNGSWAVSFGMPSQSPDVWRKDVAEARRRLPSGKALVVSVVGTQDNSVTDPEASLDQLAADFARCAEWAIESGAHGIEANFSCPNVSTADGQLYQQPESAGFVAARIRDRIGNARLVLKIGHVSTKTQAERLLREVGSSVDGLAMTNSISAHVKNSSGDLMFGGQSRGICGAATLEASVAQVALFHSIIDQSGPLLDLIGVGGISEVGHVRRYLAAGADTVAMATAAMTNPRVALDIRHAW